MPRFLQIHFVCAGVIPLLLTVGCSSQQVVDEKDRKIKDLEQLCTIRQEALKEMRTSIGALQRQLKSQDEKNSKLSADADQTATSLQAKDRKIKNLEDTVAGLEKKLKTSETSYELLQQEHDKVKTVASTTVEELADLRLKSQELVERTNTLGKQNVSLRKESLRLHKEIDQLRSDLVIARSATRGKTLPAKDTAKIEFLEKRVQQLEAVNTTLREERSALLASSGGGGSSEVAVNLKDPKAVWTHLTTIVRGRVEKVLNGEAKWDKLDIGLAVGLVVVLFAVLWILWTPMRWRKWRRQRRELVALQKRLEERAATSTPRRGDTSRRTVRRERSGPRPAQVRHSKQFSPIISGSTTTTDGAAPRTGRPARAAESSPDDRVVQEEDDGAVTVQLGINPLQRESRPPAAAQASPLGSGAFGEEVDDGSDDDFGATQLISGLGDLGVEPELDEDTQTALDGAGGAPRKKASEGGGTKQPGDQELLAELKEMIGQKLDEFIK